MSTEQNRTVVLRKVSQFMEVPSKNSINLNDILILVQGDKTKKTSVSSLMDKIVDQIVAPSAYDIAVEHGFDGTEEEWLESLRANGVSDEDFKLVVGKYQIVDCEVLQTGVVGNADISGERYTRLQNEYLIDDTVVIDDDAFVIYHDLSSGFYFTTTNDGSAIKWSGILSLMDLLHEVVGLEWFDEDNVPTYYLPKSEMVCDEHLFLRIPISDVTAIKKQQDGTESPYSSKNPKYATMIRVKNKSTDYGQLYFYDGSTFVGYTGVVPYVQCLINNSMVEATQTAIKLNKARKIELSGAATSNPENPAKFDGSNDIVIDVVSIDASKIEGTIPSTVKLEGSSSTLTTARSIGFATKIVDTDGTEIADAITEVDAAVFNGSKDVDIIIKKLNAAILSGTASISITGNAATATSAVRANKLSAARSISIDGAVTTKNSSGVDKPTAFDGSSNIVITVQSVDASKLIGTIPSTVEYEGRVSSADLANTIKLKPRGTNKMYITGSTTSPSSAGSAASEVADTSVYIDSAGKLVAPISKNLIFQSYVNDSINEILCVSSLHSDRAVNLSDTSADTTIALPYVNQSDVDQVVSGMKVFNNPRARTGSYYDSDVSTYRLRNTSIGSSSTPPSDSVYGGSGAIYLQYNE